MCIYNWLNPVYNVSNSRKLHAGNTVLSKFMLFIQIHVFIHKKSQPWLIHVYMYHITFSCLSAPVCANHYLNIA